MLQKFPFRWTYLYTLAAVELYFPQNLWAFLEPSLSSTKAKQLWDEDIILQIVIKSFCSET